MATKFIIVAGAGTPVRFRHSYADGGGDGTPHVLRVTTDSEDLVILMDDASLIALLDSIEVPARAAEHGVMEQNAKDLTELNAFWDAEKASQEAKNAKDLAEMNAFWDAEKASQDALEEAPPTVLRISD